MVQRFGQTLNGKTRKALTTPNTGQGTHTGIQTGHAHFNQLTYQCMRHTGNSDTQKPRTGLDKQTIFNPFPRNKEGVQPRRQPKSFNPQRAVAARAQASSCALLTPQEAVAQQDCREPVLAAPSAALAQQAASPPTGRSHLGQRCPTRGSVRAAPHAALGQGSVPQDP